MKVKTNITVALAKALMAMAANKRCRKQVINEVARFAMIILLLLFGTTLPSGCKAEKAVSESPAPNQQPQNFSFTGIGDLPGGRYHSEALGISDDGKVIIGRSSSARFEEEGFFRTVHDGLIVLQGPASAPVSSEPRALTPNGEIIAGKTASARGIEAARWTAATGWTGLGDIAGGMFGSQALGISADGAVIVGWGTSNAGYEAARWVNGNALAMGDLPGGAYNSAAALVSADGKTIVGTGNSARGLESVS
jgi:hypothetical protein